MLRQGSLTSRNSLEDAAKRSVLGQDLENETK